MRLVIANVPRGQGSHAVAAARANDSANPFQVRAVDPDGEREVVIIHAPNHRIDSLVENLQQIDDLRLTLLPQGVLSLYPPEFEAADQATDVTPRSPLEIFLGGLQSVGSWKGFLGYAGAAGVVVWIGLYTNTVYLLVAAMLIAPFAGPAMNLALAAARGDKMLIGRSLLRYFVSLLTCTLAAFALSALTNQQIATELMVQASLISSVTVLLPLTAGAAGALHLCQSERASLVTAAGAGMLVAASLAPPAGLIGMAAWLGDWSMVKGAVFVLLLQLVGINVSGGIVFTLFGLRPRGVRYERGHQRLRWLTLAGTTMAVIALLVWQFYKWPTLQRSTATQDVARLVQQVIRQSRLAEPIEVQVRFTRADIAGQESCLIVAYTQPASGTPGTDEKIREALITQIAAGVVQQYPILTPLVDVSVLRPPGELSRLGNPVAGELP